MHQAGFTRLAIKGLNLSYILIEEEGHEAADLPPS